MCFRQGAFPYSFHLLPSCPSIFPGGRSRKEGGYLCGISTLLIRDVNPPLTCLFPLQTTAAWTGGFSRPVPSSWWPWPASLAPATLGHGTSSSWPPASTPAATTSMGLSTTKVRGMLLLGVHWSHLSWEKGLVSSLGPIWSRVPLVLLHGMVWAVCVLVQRVSGGPDTMCALTITSL